MEKFCLSWNDFETSVSNSFKDLLGDEHFTDVTLVSEDNRQMKVHKVILSSCSPFFRNIFIKNAHNHPLLYLKGVKYSDLQSIIDFVYLGQAQVGQEDLQRFLDAAKDLEIKGLADRSEGESEDKIVWNASESKPVFNKSKTAELISKDVRFDEEEISLDEEEISSNEDIWHVSERFYEENC